jgi:hypothetical protein
MAGYKRREVRKIKREARFTLGIGGPLASDRRFVAELLEPISLEDDHVTAIAKHSLARYMERTGAEIDPYSQDDVKRILDSDSPLMQDLYTMYVHIIGKPCNGRTIDYIPTPEEWETPVENIGTRQEDGSILSNPTLRQLLPEVPPGWDEIMQERREAFPERFGVKIDVGD